MTQLDKNKIPNFFIVGAEKAGTTSLYHYLCQHPQIYLPIVKEPNFFCKDISPPKKFKKPPFEKFIHSTFIRDLDTYMELFKDVNNEIAIGEASVSYLFSKLAAREIKRFNPNAKIIIILRNPVERAFSEYQMDVTIGRTARDFLSAFQGGNKYKGKSLYYHQVKRYKDLFPAENLLIIIFEEMVKDMEKAMKRIFNFLGVDESFAPDFEQKFNRPLTPRVKILNSVLFASGIKRALSNITPGKLKEALKSKFYRNEKKKLSKKEFDVLFPLFYEDIKKLEKLTGKDLSLWFEKI